MNWPAFSAIGLWLGAVGSIAIACIAVYIGARQWLDGKRFSREQQDLADHIESRNQAAKAEQDRIIRAQSLDAYFDGISRLLLSQGVLNTMARKLTKGRTDAILKILQSDEKRNLIAFLYGSGLITVNGDSEPQVIGLSGSDLSYAELSGTNLRKAGLEMVDLRGAQMDDTDLDEADLSGAELTDANFSGAYLSRADLHSAVATDAILRDVDLTESDLSGADLRGCDLSGADLSSANLSGVNLRGANLSSANLSGVNLSGANLQEAKLIGANFRETRLTNLISIEGADLTAAENLSPDTKEYLSSIAAGTHPDTGRETLVTLNNQ